MLRRFMIVAAAAALTACSSQPARLADGQTVTRGSVSISRQGDYVLEVDRSKAGAVLCTWGLLESEREIGHRCYSEQDGAFLAELDRGAARLDAFILKNSSSHPKQSDLDGRRAALKADVRPDVCSDPASLEFYTHMRDLGVQGVRDWVDLSVSIPREPVMNPCL